MSDTSLEALNEDSDFEPEAPVASSASGRFAAFALLLCLLVFHVLANIWWLHEDNHAIRTDEEGHMELARTYHEALFVQNFPDPVRRLIAVSKIRPGIPAHPPLFHLLGALMIAVFGYSPDIIAATSTVLFSLLLLGCYCLVRVFLNPWQSVFCVAVVSFTPIVFTAARYFMTDYASACIVVWALFALARSEGFQRPGWVFLFALLNGLGILARTVTFGYILLPAVAVVLVGLIASLRKAPDTPNPPPSLGALARNIALALVVSVGVFAPWYYANLEPFYDYWANKEIAGSRGPLTNFAPTPSVATTQGSLMPDQSYYARVLRTVEAKATNPPVAWIRYPVYLVNDGLFAVLAALALLGMLVAPLRAQFRVLPLTCLYLWVLGSWVFFSVFIRSATPRYGLPIAPALALFAALFVLSLPGRWVRLTVGALLGIVLLFQYAMLTFPPASNEIHLGLPVSFSPAEARHFEDADLVVFKDHLTLGFSYAKLGAPRKENHQQRLMQAMINHERELPVRAGQFANYQKLNVRGLEFHERHYWPGDNPYRLASLAPEDIPERRLKMIHMGLEPEHLLPLLSETDYIVYEAPTADAKRATAYESYFQERGYEVIDRFDVPEFGWVPATTYGVLARVLEGELVPVTEASIAAMNLYDLHELKYSADFQRLSPALRALAQETFKARLEAVATPFQLNDAVSFVAADVSRVDAHTYRFRLVFEVHKALDRDWRMLFHGFVAPEDLSRIPADKQAQGYVDWNFDPRPAATEWVPGDYVIVTNQIVAEPLIWQFKFGLFLDETLYGRTALLQPMNLSEVP